MSLQDFRGQGPPADIGTFQLPCEVMVFQHVFAGTTYVCAVRSGQRGWVLIDYLPLTVVNVTTVFQAAINALTLGRTWKETVCIVGSYTLGRVNDASYTIVNLQQASLTVANGTNDYMFVCDGINDFEFIGGIIDGNYDDQIEGGGIRIGETTACYNFRIIGTRIFNGYRYDISIGGSYDGTVEGVILSGAGDDNIEIRNGSYDIEVIAINSYSPRQALLPAASSCLEIENGCYNISVLGGRYSDSPSFGICISSEAGLGGCHDISVVGAVIHEAALYAVHVMGLSGQLCQRINLVNLTVISEDAGSGPWIRDYCDEVTIYGGTFHVIGWALRCSNSTNITVDGPITYDLYGTQNVRIDSVSYMSIKVTITRAYRTGIYILGSSTEITVHDCIIRQVSGNTNNTYAGVTVEDSTYVKVHDNIIDGGAAGNRMDYGIEETGASDYNEFHDNRILNAQTAPIIRVGANTRIQSDEGNFGAYQSGDFGAAWATWPPAGLQAANGMIVVVYNSNAGVLASRLYCYSNGAWRYVGLT